MSKYLFGAALISIQDPSPLYLIEIAWAVSKKASFTCFLGGFAECGNRKALRLRATGVYSCK